MRNVKLLWGLICCLTLTAAVLGLLLARESGLGGTGRLHKGSASGGTNHIVAKVGNREIYSSEVEEQLAQKYGPELVNQILDRESIRLEAEETGLKLLREDIDRELARMQQGYDSEQDFYDSMKKQLSMTKDEIREDVYYKLLAEKIATRNVQISDKEVDAYIQDHPEEFHRAEMLRIQQIINKTMDQANRTIELYKSGKDFAQLAKERSLDTASAGDGGDLGWVEDNDPFVPAEILKAAGTLQVGQISGPVETAAGYAVVRLKDRKPQPKQAADPDKEAVRKMLALQQAPPIKTVIQNLRKKFEAVILEKEYLG